MNADQVQHQLADLRRGLHATEQALADMTAAWQGACQSGDEARAELEQLHPIADKAAVYVTTTARRLDALDDPTLQALVAAVDGYRTGGVS